MLEPIFVFIPLYLIYITFLRPVITYLRDPKNLRRCLTFHPLSGLSDIPFLLASQKGFRSRTLHELHKIHPVIWIGPNALSYGAPAAIRDIYGHSTACVKDRFYSDTSGTHAHLADVVDKADHARKRRILSSTYAIKNLEEWEYKVSDTTSRLIRVFDEKCTAPLPKSVEVPDEKDLTIDHRAWTNHFTVAGSFGINGREREEGLV